MAPEEKLYTLLLKKKLTITTAESCTGGLIAGTLVNVPGISDVFREAYVTYASDAKKRLLGVRDETLARYSVYSEEVAAEMAGGAAELSHADLAVSSTGIAGPDGGSASFPVGLVCIGVWLRGKITTARYYFSGDRQEIRRQAVAEALTLLIRILEEEEHADHSGKQT